MRIAQIALVTAVVIVGLLGYTKPGHRILNAIGLPNACDANISGFAHSVRRQWRWLPLRSVTLGNADDRSA